MSLNSPIIKELFQQYSASLKMIGDVIVMCKDELWQDYTQEVVISQLVYHVLGSADLFLAKITNQEKSFKNKYGLFNPPFNETDKILTKKQLSDYLKEIQTKANKIFNTINNEEFTSGLIPDFFTPYSRYGILIYNLRHLTHHIGALHARLAILDNEPLPWVNIIFGDERDKFEEMDNQGIKYLQEGKLDEAENIYLELTAKSENPIYYYNFACLYSRKENPKKAVNTLKKCFNLDPNNRFKESAKADPDLANIRDFPAFKDLIES